MFVFIADLVTWFKKEVYTSGFVPDIPIGYRGLS
jgi:hypothetical protein